MFDSRCKSMHFVRPQAMFTHGLARQDTFFVMITITTPVGTAACPLAPHNPNGPQFAVGVCAPRSAWFSCRQNGRSIPALTAP